MAVGGREGRKDGLAPLAHVRLGLGLWLVFSVWGWPVAGVVVVGWSGLPALCGCFCVFVVFFNNGLAFPCEPNVFL
jgi:hypothetical protein